MFPPSLPTVNLGHARTYLYGCAIVLELCVFRYVDWPVGSFHGELCDWGLACSSAEVSACGQTAERSEPLVVGNGVRGAFPVKGFVCCMVC